MKFMIFKDFKDKKLSALGLGCMRFPTVDGDDKQIDKAAVKEMVRFAIDEGVNYFDTAWGYHAGNSELVIGEVLSAYPRESFYLASKFPGYDAGNMARVEEIFEKQLQKCRVDYFDFYLFHNVCESNIDGYLNAEFGIYDYLLKQKEQGRIKHLGFSTHGTLETIKRFLDAYGKDMEFCQIQLNWLDWDLQNAKETVELVRSYGLPIWVMEPVRGGKLASLGEGYETRLKSARPDASVVEWAFRFLQTIPDVTVTLSGMSNMTQLKENIATYKEEKPLTKEETELLFSVARDMTSTKTLPCTSCRYCTTYCPMELDIPRLISLYNEHIYSGGGFLAPMAIEAMEENKRPSACIGCRSCEGVCPQNIKISEMMADFVSKL